VQSHPFSDGHVDFRHIRIREFPAAGDLHLTDRGDSRMQAFVPRTPITLPAGEISVCFSVHHTDVMTPGGVHDRGAPVPRGTGAGKTEEVARCL
jgi:hypothetical protein